jgi:hypothetical protein
MGAKSETFAQQPRLLRTFTFQRTLRRAVTFAQQPVVFKNYYFKEHFAQLGTFINFKNSNNSKKNAKSETFAERPHINKHFGERGRAEAVPSADVFNRISKALEVSPDYLLNGTIQDKAKNNIQDNELLLQFEKVEKLNDQKKSLVKEFLDAFILKANLQQQLS